ncbi:hypothetical protein [Catellatospora bangladeshensis]|uniref:Asp23/Gls24 family envelope stress response protein n=1 Tax=Catellatospora bangladeshensis TaxID=310355 RepID=A0A8J3NNA4_9ACTN|nr:hypothetical protein [Catellatospora bangladeshensis]GIF84665.1 hypothetical protein Cba03nite_60140 [Catellatospora bangladeshensis]
MNVSAPTPSPLVDGVDVDAVAGAARACPGVDDLLGGFPEVATYLPGRRVTGVRITDDTVELCLRADWGVPLYEVGAAVQHAVAPLAGRRSVDVTIAEVTDPPAARRTTSEQPAALGPQQPSAHPAETPAGAHGDPLMSQANPGAHPARPLLAATPEPP